MTPADYVNSVVGKPWVRFGNGPDAFDCWGLTVDSFATVDGLDIKRVKGYQDGYACATPLAEAEIGSGRWKPSQPMDGAVMVVSEKGKPINFGRCIMGGVLHAYGKPGQPGQVRWQTYQAIRRQFREITYYALDSAAL